MSLLRSIGAIIAGYFVMMLGVMVYQGLFIMLPMYLKDPDIFNQMMELQSDPAKFRSAYEDGTFPKPSTPMLAFSVFMDGLCSLLGGYVCGWIARHRKWTHVIVLLVIMTSVSLIYTTTSEIESLLPAWVPWTRSLFAIPLGLLVGGWLRVRKTSTVGDPQLSG